MLYQLSYLPTEARDGEGDSTSGHPRHPAGAPRGGSWGSFGRHRVRRRQCRLARVPSPTSLDSPESPSARRVERRALDPFYFLFLRVAFLRFAGFRFLAPFFFRFAMMLGSSRESTSDAPVVTFYT